MDHFGLIKKNISLHFFYSIKKTGNDIIRATMNIYKFDTIANLPYLDFSHQTTNKQVFTSKDLVRISNVFSWDVTMRVYDVLSVFIPHENLTGYRYGIRAGLFVRISCQQYVDPCKSIHNPLLHVWNSYGAFYRADSTHRSEIWKPFSVRFNA